MAASTIENIKKIIGENTPEFISNAIIFVIDKLENFRMDTFNSPYIFYPIFFICLFFVLRFLWRKFF